MKHKFCDKLAIGDNMRKYIENYRNQIELMIENNQFKEEDIILFREKIQDFQHERLIHLLVTLSFAFFAIVFLVLGMLSYLFLIPFFSFLIFLIFYIIHYFFLENSCQYFYKLYDKMKQKGKK